MKVGKPYSGGTGMSSAAVVNPLGLSVDLSALSTFRGPSTLDLGTAQGLAGIPSLATAATIPSLLPQVRRNVAAFDPFVITVYGCYCCRPLVRSHLQLYLPLVAG
jgi:hypothetical protein